MIKKWGSWIAVLLLIVMLVSGCSSGSQDKSDGTESKSAEASLSNQVTSTADSTAASSSDKAADKSKQETPAGGDASLPDSSAQTSEGAAGFNAQDLSGALNKKLIYKANIVMKVEDYGKGQSDIRNRVTLSGGYIMNFNETQSASEKGGTFVIKVPSSGFSPFLASLENIKHEDLQRSIEGQDVTEEYVDLDSRLKAKQLMEEQYIAFMKKATKTNDLVAFANELERIQSEIEQIKGRMRYINQNVSYSTVEVRLYEEIKEPLKKKEDTLQAPLGKRASSAFQGSVDVITLVLQWIVVILSGSLPLLIIAVIILLIVWLVRRSNAKAREEAARKRKEMNHGSKIETSGEKTLSDETEDERE